MTVALVENETAGDQAAMGGCLVRKPTKHKVVEAKNNNNKIHVKQEAKSNRIS